MEVPLAVMPKGVEHQVNSYEPWELGLVPLAVMPKGVEHKLSSERGARATPVPLAVMPKGVEHPMRLGSGWARSVSRSL